VDAALKYIRLAQKFVIYISLTRDDHHKETSVSKNISRMIEHLIAVTEVLHKDSNWMERATEAIVRAVDKAR
jgi:hypothetical protein